MHAVIRTYSGEGAKELFDLLEKRKSDVESLIRSVKGFVSYSLVRTGDGGISVTAVRTRQARMTASKKPRSGSARMGRTLARVHRRCQKVQSFFT